MIQAPSATVRGAAAIGRGCRTLLRMGFRRVVAGIGRTLITIGVLILLFVAFQLWGTGISEARDQHRLKTQFKAHATTPTTTPAPGRPLPATPVGEAVAIID